MNFPFICLEIIDLAPAVLVSSVCSNIVELFVCPSRGGSKIMEEQGKEDCKC